MDKSIFQRQPPAGKCTCIICRKPGSEPSDEHIIPKSLGGYLHTWNVCKQCNSRLGHIVDATLTNHCLTRWARFAHQLKGESGIPVKSPLEGTFKAEDGEKYSLCYEQGQYRLHLIPAITAEGNRVTLKADAGDKDKAADILRTYCARKGIPFDCNRLHVSPVMQSPPPTLSIQTTVDIAGFRIGMLKIAYEFAVGVVPDLLNDGTALKIARTLETAAPGGLDGICFAGNGFEDIFPQMLGGVIDFGKAERHYILLIHVEGKLYCFVRLFGIFCLGIKLSEKEYAQADTPVIAVNDFGRHGFELFTLDELAAQACRVEKVLYRFEEPWHTRLHAPQGISRLDFICDENRRPLCFDRCGNSLGTDIGLLESIPEECIKDETKGNITTTTYSISGKACFCLYPSQTPVPLHEIILQTSVTKY